MAVDARYIITHNFEYLDDFITQVEEPTSFPVFV